MSYSCDPRHVTLHARAIIDRTTAEGWQNFQEMEDLVENKLLIEKREIYLHFVSSFSKGALGVKSSALADRRHE